MITLTWGDLKNQDFLQSIGKLMAAPMGFDLAKSFVVIGKEIKTQQDLLQETHTKLLEKFGTPEESKPGYFKIEEEKQADYNAELDKLMDNEFTIESDRFSAATLSEIVQFSPQDLILLDAFLLPELTVAKENKEAPEANAH